MQHYKYRCKGLKRQERAFKWRTTKCVLIAWVLCAIILYAQNFINSVYASIENTGNIAEINVKREGIKETIINIAEKHGIDKWYLLKLADCESRFDQYAINVNIGHGTDRGIFQINDKYHPISNECAFNISCATEYTAKLIKEGKQHLWVCDKYIR